MEFLVKKPSPNGLHFISCSKRLEPEANLPLKAALTIHGSDKPWLSWAIMAIAHTSVSSPCMSKNAVGLVMLSIFRGFSFINSFMMEESAPACSLPVPAQAKPWRSNRHHRHR